LILGKIPLIAQSGSYAGYSVSEIKDENEIDNELIENNSG